MNSDLLARILKDSAVDDSIQKNVRDFLWQVYGHKVLSTRNPPSFEEVFTLVDLALTDGRYFPDWPRARLEALRRDMISATGELLEHHIPEFPEVHDHFIKSLFRKKSVTWKNTSFIDFNYDISLDLALIKNRKRVGDVEYGIYVRSFDVRYKDKSRRWEPANPRRALLLMKPHGSFNWTWCPTCGFVVLFPESYAGVEALSGEDAPTCTRCRGLLEPLIVPPAWAKSYRNPSILNIWQISEFLLSQAELVVFVGHSFSDADVQFKALLRRALTRKARPRIVIVSDSPPKNNETYGRYHRFFGEVVWEPHGFADFADGPIHEAIT